MPLELRRDDGYLRRCRLAFAAIVLGMPVVLAAWWLNAGSGHLVMMLPMLAWLAYSAAIAYVIFVRPLTSYRCPQCQRPLPRAEEARPWFRFRCELCGVEWDVKRSDEPGGGE
jgi:fatty acid desaturase